MKFIILILIFLGILCVVVSLVQTSNECPTSQVIYKYIPRTFEEEQNNPIYPSDVFITMFTQQSPWIRSVQDLRTHNIEPINRYFVSQY